MPQDLLAINVGNTRAQFGLFRGDKLLHHCRCAHGDADALAEVFEPIQKEIDAGGGKPPLVLLASVNDARADETARAVQRLLGLEVTRIGPEAPIPLAHKLDPEAIVGQDRLLNAAAAYDKLKEACIVVDAGTAVTVDFIDGEGTFHGGAILPGARLQARALHEHTALLPLVELNPPDEPIGHNTTEAIRTGLYHGLRGAVRELVEKYAESYGGYPRVIATGGDAQLLFEGYDLIDAIVPTLTLEGIRLTAQGATTGTGRQDAKRAKGRGGKQS